MADERDPKLTKHYRELEPLEPPPELDQKILAAAREAADSSHAPLVAPAGRHRWYYSLAAAAVLVLAVAITLHIDRDRSDLETTPAAKAPDLRPERELRGQIKPAPAPAPAAGRAPAFTPDPQASAPREAPVPRAAAPAPSPRTDERRTQAAANLRAEQAAATAGAMQAEADAAQRYQLQRAATAKQQQAAATGLAAPAAAVPENPERWLERIAELRSRGRHVEADRELASFRKAYPEYRLSEVMRERVEGTTTSR